MTSPAITSPSNQAIVTVSAAYTVVINAPSDASVNVYNGVTLLGAASSVGGGIWNYTWTPAIVASSIALNAVGNVGGQSPTIIVTVAEANTISTTMTTWSKSNAGITITGGVDDPLGGNNAYAVRLPVTANTGRYIYNTASTAPSVALDAFEVWVRPHNITQFYVSSSGSAKGIYFDLSSGQAKSTALYGAIVETGINGWLRVQIARAAEAYLTQTFYWYFTQTLGVANINISSAQAATGYGLDFYMPRFVGTVSLPLTAQQDLAIRYDSTTNGVEQWYWKHPYMDSAADMVGIGDASYNPYGCSVQVIRPTGWSSANKYRVLWMLPALEPQLEANIHVDNAVQCALGGGYANLYNCIVLIPYSRSGSFWFGSWANGTLDQQDFAASIIWQWAVSTLSASTSREDHLAIGYSKSGWAAFQMLMRNPTKFGYACSGDGPFNVAYSYADVAAAFGSSGQFDLYNTKAILPSHASAVNDRIRLFLYKGPIWNPDFADMCAVLDANAVPYYSDTTAWGSGPHAWGTTTWTPIAVAKMFALSTANANDFYITNPHSPLNWYNL